jgi:drug/metabolite transporter (DMT)-like permease
VVTAIVISQSLGLAATLVLVALSGQPAPGFASLTWAGIAGLVGFIGLGAFYYAMARGTMGIVTPLAALIGAGVPVAVAIAAGEQVSTLRLAGVGVGLLAVVLISLPAGPRTAGERRALRVDLAELPMVVVAGLGFAGFFLFIDRALREGADMWWALSAVRVVGLSGALTLVVALLVLRARPGGAGQGTSGASALFRLGGLRSLGALAVVTLFAGAGLGDFGGNGFFVLARGQDLLSVAVVLSSLYPVVTTLLAAALLHERLSGPQLVGVALAIVAVVLIGLG